MAEILLWFVVIVLFGLGLAGTVVPVLPGVGFIFGGILVYGIFTDFAEISPTSVVVFGVVAILAWLATFYGGAIGARASGGGRYAAGGTIVGAVVGLLTNGPLGLLVGAGVGALVGALLDGREPKQASMIALLSVIGTLSATVVQFVLGASMIAAFILTLVL